MGASGPAVRQVQRILARLGYPVGKIDGRFGVRTLRAVVAFQSAHELPVDGVVAANTWMMLERHMDGIEPVEEEVRVSLPMVPPEAPMPTEPLPVPPSPPMPSEPPPQVTPQPMPMEPELPAQPPVVREPKPVMPQPGVWVKVSGT